MTSIDNYTSGHWTLNSWSGRKLSLCLKAILHLSTFFSHKVDRQLWKQHVMTQDAFNNDNHARTLAISNRRIARELTALQFTHHPFSLGATVTLPIQMFYIYT